MNISEQEMSKNEDNLSAQNGARRTLKQDQRNQDVEGQTVIYCECGSKEELIEKETIIKGLKHQLDKERSKYEEYVTISTKQHVLDNQTILELKDKIGRLNKDNDELKELIKVLSGKNKIPFLGLRTETERESNSDVIGHDELSRIGNSSIKFESFIDKDSAFEKKTLPAEFFTLISNSWSKEKLKNKELISQIVFAPNTVFKVDDEPKSSLDVVETLLPNSCFDVDYANRDTSSSTSKTGLLQDVTIKTEVMDLSKENLSRTDVFQFSSVNDSEEISSQNAKDLELNQPQNTVTCKNYNRESSNDAVRTMLPIFQDNEDNYNYQSASNCTKSLVSTTTENAPLVSDDSFEGIKIKVEQFDIAEESILPDGNNSELSNPGTDTNSSGNAFLTRKINSCPHCDYCTFDEDDFINHARVHRDGHGHRSYNGNSNINTLLQREVESNFNIKHHKCNHCDYTTRYASALVIHERIHTGEKPFKCDHCDYASSDGSVLRRHKKIHSNDRPFKCNLCGKEFYRSYDFRQHQLQKHLGQRLFKCDHCQYSCAGKNDLLKHLRTHTGEKPFKCDQCDYASRTKGDLVVHRRKHTGERPFKCIYCEWAFIKKNDLTKHQRRHEMTKN